MDCKIVIFVEVFGYGSLKNFFKGCNWKIFII